MKRDLITIDNIHAVAARKGYKVFSDDTKEFNLNIWGFRSSDRVSNKFDDWYSIFWKYKGAWNQRVWAWTTDPGRYWLQRLLNPKGCAILVPGQYLNVWAIDKHLGKYDALCQRLGPVKVYRDKDRDNIIEMDPRTIDTGMFGINHHHAGAGIRAAVENASAGCQVASNYDDFVEARILWFSAKARWGNSFSYTLVTEEDFK